MNVVTLRVAGSLPGDLTFELTHEEKRWSHTQPGADLTLEELAADLSRFDEILPPQLGRKLQQSVLVDPTPGLLAIISAERHLDGIPWEHLPTLLQLPTVYVARLLDGPGPMLDRSTQDPLRLLAAGWSGRPWLNLPGIQKELNALSQLGVTTDVRVRVLFEPNLSDFAEAYGSIQPDVLHLVPPAVRSDHGMPAIALSGGKDLEWVGIDQLAASLPDNLQPRLAVINSCSSGESDGGPSATRLLTERLGAITIGWIGKIADLAAVDFALFFYTRLLEGGTVVDALRAYRSLQPSQGGRQQATRDVRPARRDFPPTPVVWAPALDPLVEPLLARRREEAGPAAEYELWPKGGLLSPGVAPPATAAEPPAPAVEVDFEPQKWLNPALLKNGWPAIVRLALTPDRVLHNAEIAITCDTGNGTSTVRQTLNLKQGPQPIPADTLQFPVLYELIEAAVPRRQINFTVTCSHAGHVLVQTTQSVLWMGNAEWLDKKDTWRFIPAFVDPYADGVLDVIDVADGLLKKMVSPTSAFTGYQTGDSDFVVKQVEAVFNALRDEPFQLKYINPPPIPVHTPGDLFATGQRVRSPDEVVGRHRGTCHDLAILFASSLEHVGIYPLIILIRGHTLIGFWVEKWAHEEFWREARDDILRQPQVAGREWTIVDLEELCELERKGWVCFVEATRVTDRNAEFEKAVRQGHDHLESQKGPGGRFDVAVDIRASRSHIQPL
jgi:hypothetical protein